MKKSIFGWKEGLTMLVMYSLVIIGVVLSFTDNDWFVQEYVKEDGFIEWGTVLPLLLVAGVCLSRIVRWAGKVKVTMLIGLAVLAILCIFAGGEEISWGQRILGIESSEFFKQNNAQQETNLHNMVVGKTKINKLVFSQLLVVVMALYLLALPWLYRKKRWVQNLVNSWSVPVPQVYQIVAFILLFILTGIGPQLKKAELLEFGSTVLFSLIVLFPMNKEQIAHPVIAQKR